MCCLDIIHTIDSCTCRCCKSYYIQVCGICFVFTRPQVIPLLGRFSQIHELLQPYGYGEDSLDGALFDVGASSMQFDDYTRGFSLSHDGPLDMRMDKGR